MTWTIAEEEDHPRFTSIWEPLPPDYSPLAPVADQSVSMPLQTRILPLLMAAPGALPPFRNPLVGNFVPGILPPPAVYQPGQPMPADLLLGGTFYRNPHKPYTAHPFRIGVDALGDINARVGGDKIAPFHGELPNDTVQTPPLGSPLDPEVIIP